MSNEVPQLDYAFAQLVADAMRPHLKEELRLLVENYMGQNGDTHRKDHKDLREFLTTMAEDRKVKKERREAVLRQVLIWSIITAIVGVGFLAHYWLTTMHEKQMVPTTKERRLR